MEFIDVPLHNIQSSTLYN